MRNFWARAQQSFVNFFDTEPGSIVWIIKKLIDFFELMVSSVNEWLNEAFAPKDDDDTDVEENINDDFDDVDESEPSETVYDQVKALRDN